MPAATAPLAGFVLGVAFAWAAADERARATDPLRANRGLALSVLFGLFVLSPISAYFLSSAPDWSYAYWVDPERVPAAVGFGLVVLVAASVPIGFLVAAARARGRQSAWILRILIPPSVFLLLLLGATLPRLSVDATYAQYNGDFGTHSVTGTPLGYGLVWMSAVLVFSVVWTLSWLRRLG